MYIYVWIVFLFRTDYTPTTYALFCWSHGVVGLFLLFRTFYTQQLRLLCAGCNARLHIFCMQTVTLVQDTVIMATDNFSAGLQGCHHHDDDDDDDDDETMIVWLLFVFMDGTIREISETELETCVDSYTWLHTRWNQTRVDSLPQRHWGNWKTY